MNRTYRPLHRWLSGRGTSTRPVSSAVAALLSCQPSAQVQNSWDSNLLARCQLNSKQRVICYPTFSVSIRRFAVRSTKRQRGNFFSASDYNNINDLLRDSIDVLNSGGFLPAAPVWARISRLMSDRQPRQVDDHPLLQQHVDELFQHTINSMDHMKPKDLSTIILSMAKIAKTIREAKRRRKMNGIHLIFCQLLLDEDFRLMRIICDSCATAADRILPKSDARHISNLAYAYALIGYDPKLGNQTLLGNIGDASVGFIQKFNGQDISNMVWACATLNVAHTVLFRTVADHIEQLGDLESFNPQALANIIWAYATLGIDHSGLFKKVGDHVNQFGDLGSFKPQELANIAWAHATLDINHPGLLKKIGDHICHSGNLKFYKPQNLANLAWAYATLGVEHPELLKKVGDSIEKLDDLESFRPQALSNIVWSYATLYVEHRGLFNKVGDHIDKLNDLKSYKPQDFSNVAWAYATAGVHHQALFDKFADHLVALDSFRSFTSQALANIVWAYATAGVQHTALFNKVGDHIAELDNLKSFNPQALANIAWAYASANEMRADLLDQIGNAVANRANFQSFNQQALANIAWAYTVANADAPMIFNSNFANALFEGANKFDVDECRQLYQWHLWQTSELSHTGLPRELREQCYHAFTTAATHVSRFQKDVVRELESVGLKPVEEYLAPSGYSIDALVEVGGRSIGIEVDGPSHFIHQKPTATTLLKRRQIRAIDKLPLVSVPYWEWEKLGKDRVKKRQYLRGLIESLEPQEYPKRRQD